MHTLNSAFSTPIFINNISILTDEDINYLKGLEYYGPNAGGNVTSANLNILEDIKLLKLKTSIEENLNLYLRDVIAPSNDVTLQITQSWINKNPKNTMHHKHNHSNSIVSGVYYISPNPAPIWFEQVSSERLRVDSNTPTPYNCESYKVNCIKDNIVIFPSHLHHFVEVNNSDDERLSLSFNTFYKGTIGNKKSISHLELK